MANPNLSQDIEQDSQPFPDPIGLEGLAKAVKDATENFDHISEVQLHLIEAGNKFTDAAEVLRQVSQMLADNVPLQEIHKSLQDVIGQSGKADELVGEIAAAMKEVKESIVGMRSFTREVARQMGTEDDGKKSRFPFPLWVLFASMGVSSAVGAGAGILAMYLLAR